jgi:hypothetical protein
MVFVCGRAADQDGGQGSMGTVVEVTGWEGVEHRGVVVRWDRDPGHTHAYRWANVLLLILLVL